MLHTGDRILEVNGVSVDGKSLEEVYSMFRCSHQPKSRRSTPKKQLSRNKLNSPNVEGVTGDEDEDNENDDYKNCELKDEDYVILLFIPQAYHMVNLAAVGEWVETGRWKF